MCTAQHIASCSFHLQDSSPFQLPSNVLELCQVERYAAGVRRFDFDEGLGPYDLASYGRWRALAGHISMNTIHRLSPLPGGNISVTSEVGSRSTSLRGSNVRFQSEKCFPFLCVTLPNFEGCDACLVLGPISDSRIISCPSLSSGGILGPRPS